mmetsp:Transcript_10686/g.27948  ORF Transcript_10686/g.27948 Transcript_10686/m.27948 type:complete len:112 (+) Transcript_10686:267-602(+)
MSNRCAHVAFPDVLLLTLAQVTGRLHNQESDHAWLSTMHIYRLTEILPDGQDIAVRGARGARRAVGPFEPTTWHPEVFEDGKSSSWRMRPASYDSMAAVCFSSLILGVPRP